MNQAILYPVQYLRAAAALAVFYYHISATVSSIYGKNSVNIDEVGAAGVDLFFVISGFIMAMIIWNRPIKFTGFFVARLIRIAPLYWLATLAVFIGAWIMPSLFGSTTADPLQLLHSLLFIPYGLDSQAMAPTLIVGWTLNYEMFFYLIVGLSAALLGDHKLIIASLFFCMLVAMGYLFDLENIYLRFYLSPMLLEFVMGIIVFHLWRLTQNRSNDMIFKIGLVAAVAFLMIQFESFPGTARVILWGLPSAMLLLSALHVIQFRNEFLRRLGDWSYSIYIGHLFVILGFYKLLLPSVPMGTLP